MALPILDGNQSATTLSTIITGGAHIPAHTVVSLGTQAKSDITSAISGSVVSISNFPSTQTIAGTVTANVGAVDQFALKSALDEYAVNYVDPWPIKYANTHEGDPFPISGTVTVSNSVTIGSLPAISGTVTARLQDASGNNLTSTSIGGLQRLNVSLASAATPGGSLPSFVNVYGGSDGSAVRTISVDSTGRTVVTGTISAQGTVTAGMLLVENAANSFPNQNSPVQLKANAQNGSLRVRMDYLTAADANSDSVIGSTGTTDPSTNAYVKAKVVAGTVTIGSLPSISGTVTVGNNNFNIKTVIAQDGSANLTAFNGTQFRLYTPTGASKTLNNIFGPTPSWVVAFSDSVTWFSDSGTQVVYFHDGTQWTLDDLTTPAGTLALNGSVFITNLSSESNINLLNGFTAAQVGSAYINGSGALRVSLYSSTVTAAAPNGSLTTRFGTPTTASVAFATSCVTNANRKYLLIQNVTTGSNVITVGIGFTPTTTRGIQLTAGAGITFESSYIPIGAVYVLSSVTASNFTILEA